MQPLCVQALDIGRYLSCATGCILEYGRYLDSTVAKLVRDWLAGGELLNRCSLHELHIQVLTRHNRTESSLQPVGLSK